MPIYSVSCTDEQARFLMDNMSSKSKIFQLGVQVAQMGGVDAFEKTKKELDQLRTEMDLYKTMSMEWKKKFFEIKKELNAFQIVFERTSVIDEAEKKEAERVERLLQDSKQNQ